MKNKIKEEDKVEDIAGFKSNMIEWLVYFVGCMLCLSPFFPLNDIDKLIGLSILISFFAGILNRISKEIIILREVLKRK